MKTPILLLIGAALLLTLVLGAEKPVAAGSAADQPATTSGLSIQTLARKVRATPTPPDNVRDPFMAPPPAAAMPEAVAAMPASAPAAPAFGNLRVLGKQQDDEGWSVFIAAPGNLGQVWVVREGESFNDNYRVSKLAPPLLVVRNTRSGNSKTFDIGKDEE